MAQNSHQRATSSRVAAWLSQNEHNNAWLSEKAGIDVGTVGDFLNGMRWPKRPTQGRIEKALGWPAGSIHQMGQGDPVDVPMVEGVVGGDTQDVPGSDSGYVSAPGATTDAGITNEDLLREILRSRADSDQIRAEQREQRRVLESLSERLADLEQRGT